MKGKCNIVQQLITDRYYDKFNFYFAKPINEILAKYPAPHVVLLKDFEYWDQNYEYLQSFHKRPKQFLRLIRPQQIKPNICVIPASKIIDKRYRKLAKLRRNFTKTIDKDIAIEEQVLKSINDGKMSFDSSVHDVYQDEGQKKIQQPLDIQFDPNENLKLWETEDLDDIELMFSKVITSEKRRIQEIQHSIQKHEMDQDIRQFLRKKEKQKLPMLDILKINNTLQKKFEPPSVKQSNQLSSLIQSYSRKQRGFHTERPPLSHQQLINRHIISISPKEPRSHIQQTSKDKPQFVNMQSFQSDDRTLSFKMNSYSMKKPEVTVIKANKRSVVDKDQLLKVLKLQSQPNSPSRRFEIKFSLNKIIQEQTIMKSSLQEDNSYGFWTSRNNQQVKSFKK